MSADGPAPHRLAEARRLYALAEHAAAVVAVADAAGGFTSENPGWAAYTGQAATACAGDGWLAALHDDDRAATTTAWRATVSSARPGHALEVDVAAGELWLDADPARIVQVVGNLLHNAAKYTRDGGRIRLSARRDGARAVVEVVDNGIGIAAADQAEQFQMFRQLPHTAGRAKGGLGIGLALVRRLVEMHGGEVTVHSEGLDRGSTFRVALPLAAAPGATAAADARPRDVHAPHRDPLGLDVLVVEDNVDGRESLVPLLREAGCRVHSAPDGARGLSLALETEPQVVLLDIGLPGLDGLDVARRLREDARGRRMHLVALTGWGAENDRARTADVGFDAHLAKPVDAATLLQHLAKVPKHRG